MKSLVITAIIFLAGCGSSTAVNRATVTERPDSLKVKGDSIAFTAHSDSLIVDSIQVASDTITPPSVPPLNSRGGKGGVPTPGFLYLSVHATKDTTIGRFKFRFGYRWPGDWWTFELLQGDTTLHWKVRDSLIEKSYEVEVVPFWVKLIIGVLGTALIISLVKR